MFATQAEALNRLHAFSPEHALMTEITDIYQREDKLIYVYKIPDAAPIVGDWVYRGTMLSSVDDYLFSTESEAFDDLLEDTRSAV